MADSSSVGKMIKTRFAPSPTGLLHIGGARTALFNYLWAKRNDGRFLLRFEDTDKARSSLIYADSILEDLAWLGISPDEEALMQTSRFERHRQALDELIERGAVYPCFCQATERVDGFAGVYTGKCRRLSPQERESRLAAGESHCWRLSVDRGERSYVFRDRLHGTITVPTESMGDFVLTRADGTCTYLFAVVVDDHDASITHVIRGEEHISNTPRQEMIYRALGWDIPEWVHIPMILDEARHKLSKRSGAISLASYREEGWSPEAITAYLATLSWSGAPADRLPSLAELAGIFELDAVALSSPVHDPERLRHFGKLALAAVPPDGLLEAMEGHFPEIEERQALSSDRAEMLSELLPFCATERELARALDEQFCYQPSGEDAGTPPWLAPLGEALTELSPQDWTQGNIKQRLKIFAKERELKGKDFYHGLRRQLTGKEDGVPVALLIACLGKKRVLDKIGSAG